MSEAPLPVQVSILVGDPVVEAIGEMSIRWKGVEGMIRWVKKRRPDCIPSDTFRDPRVLFPHALTDDNGRMLSDNELFMELAGRECYHSFGLKAGRKSNAEYIAHTQQGAIPHASIGYHPKMSFFIGGVSRRVSHELIRNYVGADRDEEGSPSQESTRFTHHYGYYIAPPHILDTPDELGAFERAMRSNYEQYIGYIERQVEVYIGKHGKAPTGMDRKRIYESASSYLSHACETSWIWTTNPMALVKLFRERGDQAADREFQRLARTWARVCVAEWPNLFQQSWVRELAQVVA